MDHVPPKACFEDGYTPEGFEFPACGACNSGTRKQDQVFGFYSMYVDFDVSKLQRPQHRNKLERLAKALRNNYPDALIDPATIKTITSTPHIVSSTPLAISIGTPPAVVDAISVMGAKLTHALYFRETNTVLTNSHLFCSASYQPQQAGTDALTTLMQSLLPNIEIGKRTNIKLYGDRFRYLSGFKTEGLFCWAAQFGHGIILWGLARATSIVLPPPGSLASLPWQSAACGPGAPREVADNDYHDAVETSISSSPE
jgi:hypothetical protein